MHLSIFISVINQLDAQNFCFTVSLFHTSTCFEQMWSSGSQNCITQPLVSSYILLLLLPCHAFTWLVHITWTYAHTPNGNAWPEILPGHALPFGVWAYVYVIWTSHVNAWHGNRSNKMCGDTRGCVMQFWPPDNEHMCSKYVEAWNKLTVKQKFCASSWLITEIKN